MPIDKQGTNVTVGTVAKINPLTNRPFVWWLNSVHKMYSSKHNYCTFARRTKVITDHCEVDDGDHCEVDDDKLAHS